MKKIVALCFILLLFASCSLSSEDDTGYSFEVLPVENVEIPDEFVLGETYPITISYFRPTTCHTFKAFYYLKETNIRTVAPINYVSENNDTCTDLEDVVTEASFNFNVTSNGSYIFKFWHGKDDNNGDVYLTIEVPVID